MAVKSREELVGKRFVSLKEGSWGTSLKGNCSEDLDWRCGVIRAAAPSPPYLHNHDIRVLVEYDGSDWHDRHWVAVCERFEVFLIEETVVWAPRKFIRQPESSKKLFPALTFRTLIDKIGLNNVKMITKPVEFLVDRQLEFLDRGLPLQAFKEVDLKSDALICDDPLAMECVQQWMEFQDSQQILLQTPSIVIGYRVQVYRSEGTTQWYTAVIKSYSEDNQMLDVTDDTVLEEHQVNPALVQVNLLGDGVINSILRGEESGIRASRKRRCCQIIRYNSTSSVVAAAALQSPLRANKRQSGAKGINLSVTSERISADCENCKGERTVGCSKRKPLHGTSISQKLLKQSNFNSSGYASKSCEQNVSMKRKFKTQRKLLRIDKIVVNRNFSETVASVERVNKSHETSSSTGNIQTNRLRNSCGIKQELRETSRNERRNGAGLRKECNGLTAQTSHCNLPASIDTMPKLKVPAAGADYRNSSTETQEAQEHLNILKSVVSARHAMSLMPPKSVANLPSSAPVECLNLSAKATEARKQLLSVVKANDSRETNISGLNLNQSVTDQITQRSREKVTRMTTSNETLGVVNSTVGCVPTVASVQHFKEAGNMRGLKNFGGDGNRDIAVILNNSFLQQRNLNVSNALNCQSESNQIIAKSMNSKPVNISHMSGTQSRSEAKAALSGAESLVVKLSTVSEETRKSIGLNAVPYSLPLFSQAPTTTSATHQLPRGTPSLVNQTIPLSHLLLQNQIALQMEQWRLLEKQIQLPTSAGTVGAILAAYPQYLPNAISPEMFWLHYQERLRDAILLQQQQQQQQQQQASHSSDSENVDGKTVSLGISKVVKDVSGSMVPENSKKDVFSTNSLPQKKITDSRIREPSKESVVERSRDAGHSLLKRSELIVHGTVNDAIDQHFSESLRLAGQKPSAVMLPSGSDHRISLTQPDGTTSNVCQEQDQLAKPRTEPSHVKEGQKMRVNSTSAVMAQMPISLSTSLHLPLALSSFSATASVQATGIMSSSVCSSASVAPGSITGNLTKMEPNFNLYGYQPCAIYLPQNAVDMQGVKDDKKKITNEQGSRKNCTEKYHSVSVDACRQPSSLVPVLDDGRLKDAIESRSFVVAGLGQRNHSPQIQKTDSVNTSVAKNLVSPEKYLASSGDEVRAEGSLNYVMAASASKGHPVFIPVLPVLSNGQAPIVKMPTLKDCLASKPPVSKIVLGSEGVAGNVILNGQAFGAHPSVVAVPDRTPNGLLTSLPISSATAVYSFGLSHSQGLHLLQNSVPSPTVSSATISSSSFVASSASVFNNCPQNATKRDHRMMTNETNSLPNDLHINDVIKKFKTNTTDSVPTSRTSAANSAVVTLVPNSTCPTTAAVCSPNSTKMHLTYSDCFRSFVETTNGVGKSHGAAEGQVFQAGSMATDRERVTVIVSREGMEEDKYRVLDLRGSTAIKMQENVSEVARNEANRGADSDTLSASSPATPFSMVLSSSSTMKPVRSDLVTQKQWMHTKFKKAMLQRYSDEDKTSVTTMHQDADLEIKRVFDNDVLISEDKEDSGSCGGTNNDATSVVSEQDLYEWTSTTDSRSSSSARKKRKSNRLAKSEPPDKAFKLSSDTDESTTSSFSAVTLTLRKKKERRQNKEERSEDEKPVSTQETIEAMTSRNHASCLSFLNSSQFQVPDCQSKIVKRQEELKHSTCRVDPSVILANKALNSGSEEDRQQTMEVFLQDGACRDVTPRLVKCRECKLARSKKEKRVPNDFCRFYAFRRLRYSPKRFLTTAGFSEPEDADALDIELWMPLTPVMVPPVDTDTAKYIVTYVGNRFINLVEQEQEAVSWALPESKMAWKRAVQGVREMCDICDATLFNVHWVCEKCGFAVCIHCFRIRSHKKGEGGSDHCRDENCHLCEHHKRKRKWLTCSANRQTHEPNQLMMAQIIPSDVLWVVGKMLKQVQTQFCFHSKVKSEDTSVREVSPSDGLKEIAIKELSPVIKHEKNSQSMPTFSDLSRLADGLKETGTKESPLGVKRGKGCRSLPAFSDLSLLAEAAAAQDAQQMGLTNGLSKDGHGSSSGDKCSTLKDLLTKATSSCPSGSGDVLQRPPGASMQSSLEEIIHKVMKLTSTVSMPKAISFSHYFPCNRPPVSGRAISIPKYTLEQSKSLFPDVLHSWLDDGRVLWLLSPQNNGNVRLFQQQWHHNLPVLISNCSSLLDSSIWKPETFLKEFGNFETQLVNCIDGDEIDGQRMKKFWDGFERISNRLKDKGGRPMILKLKNWPPKDEFCELMPNHFQNLLHNLPLPEYTKSNGPFNLVSRLPEFFAKPDLGPKLCCAYGQAKHCQAGTTNLHIDVSDAFNLLVYVGIPKDDLENQKSVAEALEISGYCHLTKDRLKEPETKPGAVWYIYDPEDADKIRNLLNKVASERGEEVDLHHDPIHEQSWYLDQGLRDRLSSEYGVQCCTVVQCLGDAIFIPAVAPHQVCNLNSCIKVTSDFVSPESLDNCFKMTQECCHLSGEAQRASHEDKLQVKNILYHAVKDATAVLNEALPKYEG